MLSVEQQKDRGCAASTFAALVLGLCLVQPLACVSAHAGGLPECSKAQLLGYVPADGELKAHRQFTVPAIDYPYGTKPASGWGLSLVLRIDESGRVVCFDHKDGFGNKEPLNDARSAMIDKLGQWRYAPFERDGHPVAAIVTEEVSEQERPERHVPLPDVPIEKVSIALERTGCFGTCPHYVVVVRGDGSAWYRGDGFVDVQGRHEFRVDPDDVKRLVQSLRDKDLWSLRPEYRSGITDNPTYLVVLTFGGQEHKIIDYVGRDAGMPSAVSDFEEQIDKAGHSDRWVHLSIEALENLKSEGFAFRSQAGADMLARAVANSGSHDDLAMLRLLQLGAPTTGGHARAGTFGSPGPLIDVALRNHRAALIDPLIAQGALDSGGRPDQAKVDAAFREAIAGGQLALVQRIWEVSATKAHPSLTFTDIDDDKHVHKDAPVTLLLNRDRFDKGVWEGKQIAQWLATKGCNLKAARANGTTLLHIATDAGDVGFVRYLLDQGMDPSTPGEFGLPALGSAEREDVALMLLEAGTDPSRLDEPGRSGTFRKYAEGNHWQSVVTWLDAQRK